MYKRDETHDREKRQTGNRGTFREFTALQILFLLSLCSGQNFFDPHIDDVTFLDTLQGRIKAEVNVSKINLLVQAKLTEQLAKQYVAVQLKENIFLALRSIAEKELDDFKKTGAIIVDQELYQSRLQDSTFLQVSNLIKTIFGAKTSANLTNYVEELTVTDYESKPLQEQVMGLINALLGMTNGRPPKKTNDLPIAMSPYQNSTAGRPPINPSGKPLSVDEIRQLQSLLDRLHYQTAGYGGRPPPPQFNERPYNGPPPPYNQHQQQGPPPDGAVEETPNTEQPSITTVPPTPGEGEDEYIDITDQVSGQQRQFSLANIFNLFRTTPAPVPITPAPLTAAPAVLTLETLPNGQQQIVVQQGAAAAPAAPAATQAPPMNGTLQNIQEFVRIMPDLIRGASEGVKLIQTLTQLLGGLEGIADLAGGLGGIIP